MALTTASLTSSLNSIGISQAKGVELPLLRDQNNATLPKAGASSATTSSDSSSAATRYTASTKLTEAQQQRIAELQQTDRTVRAHEQAHIAAGHGVVTSGPNYSYTYGPDGKPYATGGEVGIDTSPERKPEANIDKGIRIQAAALAPKDPSTQDYQVATVGERMETQGRSDLYRQQVQQAADEAAQAAERRKEEQATAQSASSTNTNAVPAANQASKINQVPGTSSALPTSEQNATGKLLVQAYGPAKDATDSAAAVSVFA
ncbi:MAG TPA: putative metalloprotease CJM1_0395 family protein [Rhodocyclaceae bacterium]|jgi:hypothetical protein